MKHNVLAIGTIFILLASACAPKATPTVNPADIASTAQAAALTMVAQTQQALPTNTPAPTLTASPMPLPTDAVPTLPALVTPDAQVTPLSPSVALPTALPTFTPQALSNSNAGVGQDPCNQPLTTWQGDSAKFTIVNDTKPKGSIVLGLYVVTEMGQCGNLVITSSSFTGPAGQYSAAAFIDGKQHYKAFGSFKVTAGNWKIIVRNNTITAGGSCFPNC